MDNYLKLQKYSLKILQDCNITLKNEDKYKVVDQVAIYLDSLLFNIVSIICLICVLNGKNTIDKKAVEVSKQHIQKENKFYYTKVPSRKTTGGRIGSATFLGINEPMYNENNLGTDLLKINLSGDILRPQIGGASKKVGVIYKYMNDLIKYHGLKSSKEVKEMIYKIIQTHINGFIKKLKSGEKISLTKLNKILKTNKAI